MMAMGTIVGRNDGDVMVMVMVMRGIRDRRGIDTLRLHSMLTPGPPARSSVVHLNILDLSRELGR